MSPPEHPMKSALGQPHNVARFVKRYTHMMRWLAASSVLLVGACVTETHRGGRQEPDAGPDADCAQPQTFFQDRDNDGHGDAALSVQACEQPAGTAAVGDDCDDTNANRHPGATDICDGVDNDCTAATAETCPAGCLAVHRPPPDDTRIYLFCSNQINWPDASASCASAGAGFHLVQIDDQAENDFVRQTANNMLGMVNLHIGGNDRTTENQWVWESGDGFWMGGPGGQAVMNRFQSWHPGDEPNNADGAGGQADCAELRADSRWYDSNCGDNQRYVCRL